MIKYVKGDFKYQLEGTHRFKTKIRPSQPIYTFFIDLDMEGNGIVRKGYAWDGPSGIAIDTKNFMRPSLEHDVKYQLMREKELAQKWRATADLELKEACLEEGMGRIRAEYVYMGVRDIAKFAANPKNRRKILTA